MGRFLALVLTGSVALGLGVCQQAGLAALPKIGPATALDVRVREVQWQPWGNGLLYTREEDKGIGIGVFSSECREGKVLLHLTEDDTWEAQWFESAPSVIVNVYRKVKSDKGDFTEVEVWLLDAKAQKATKMFSAHNAPGQSVEVNVDNSPSMIHAVFRVSLGKEKHAYVLPLSRTALVAAPEIDRAEKDGFNGPVWSVDGTATYSRSADADIVRMLNNGEVSSTLIRSGAGSSITLSLGSGAGEALLADGLRFSLRFSPPAPPVGSPVLELMPAMPVLRPVRFRGEWAEAANELPPLSTQRQTSHLQFGISKGDSQSLWLTNGDPKTTEAVLISSHAQNAWLGPENKAVAYVVDGALFVRTLVWARPAADGR